MLLVVLALVLMVMGFSGFDAVRTALAGTTVTAVLVILWAVLSTRAQHRHYQEALAAWAAERATQAERLRIARDLHDLVSHGLGLITLRASAASTVTGPDGEAERAGALIDIEKASRRTTTELRRMLTILRTSGAPLRPSEALEDLPAIVQTANDAGLTVDLDVAELGKVSPGVQLTVCTVVREALTNTSRHAGPTRARVQVHQEQDELVVHVRDDGPRPGWRAEPGAGHGLDGLRERVTALDGTLHAAPARDGWALTARLPDRSPT